MKYELLLTTKEALEDICIGTSPDMLTFVPVCGDNIMVIRLDGWRLVGPSTCWAAKSLNCRVLFKGNHYE